MVIILFPKKAYSKGKYKIYKKVKITMTNIIYQNNESNTYLVKGQRTSYNIKSINLINTKLISFHQIVPTEATPLT